MPKQITETKSQDRERVVKALKALSNENRMAIFEQIRAGHGRGRLDADNRLSVCTVAEKFDISLSTISHHIKELRAGGLVHCERRGQSIL
jgi:ArsR family transcriptional regulator